MLGHVDISSTLVHACYTVALLHQRFIKPIRPLDVSGGICTDSECGLADCCRQGVAAGVCQRAKHIKRPECTTHTSSQTCYMANLLAGFVARAV